MRFLIVKIQAKKERRRRRRDVKSKLKTWTEDAFGPGPQFFTNDQTTSIPKSSKSKENDDDSTTNDEDTYDRMWRRQLKQSRSSSEAARIRRAWQLWQSTIERSNLGDQSTAESERDFSSNKNDTDRTNQDARGSAGNTTDWFSAWEAAFPSSNHSNFNTDYETSWSYGSDARDARSQAFAWQQKQREQAGNAHPRFEKHSQRSFFALSKEVRSNLSLLGLAHLPTAIELKTAFRTSCMAYHPDRHPDPKEAATAEEKFKQVHAAFSYLKPMIIV
jgi:hypothetical protein